MTAKAATKTAAAWATAREFAANHPHIDWTATETVVRFESNSCGNGHTIHISLASNRPEHADTVIRQTVWDDGDATHVSIQHGQTQGHLAS